MHVHLYVGSASGSDHKDLEDSISELEEHKIILQQPLQLEGDAKYENSTEPSNKPCE